ncbi:hypothetical protein ACWD3L_06440, partial [Streptomyces sp. NPDC002587]
QGLVQRDRHRPGGRVPERERGDGCEGVPPPNGIDWAVIGPFTGAAILGAWDGKRLAAKVTGTLLQRTFAIVLLAVAAFMLLDALT